MTLVESANGVTCSASIIIDKSGCPWSLVASATSGLQVMIKGTIDTTTANVTQLLYWNHGIYQQTAGHWYKRALGAWSPTTDPRIVESINGTSLKSATGQIIDANKNIWTLATATGFEVMLNGQAAGFTANVVLLLYWNHTIYQANNVGGWWLWNNGWVGTTDPRIVSSGDVTINFAQPTGTTVPKYLYGFSTGAMQDASPNFGICTDPSFVASAVKLKPTLIRFNITSGVVQQYNNGNRSVMDNFWNNYQQFCDPQVRLIMGVPGGNDTSISPATCASWASNFAQAMRDQGHEITYWEVGNELDGLGPNAYASYFNPIADALHAVNPNYLVGGPVASWWNGIDLHTFANLSGSRCGFINFHYYAKSPGILPPFSDALGPSASQAARNQVQGTSLANLPIAVLEYNEITVPDSSAAGASQGQIYGAVWIALLLSTCVSQEAAANSGNLMFGLWDIVNDSNYGVIGNQFAGGWGNYTSIDPQGWYLGYAGQTMPGSQVLASTTESNLHVMATINDGKFAIQLVNYDVIKPVTVNVAATGITLPASVTRWELSPAKTAISSTLANLSSVAVPAQSIVILTGG